MAAHADSQWVDAPRICVLGPVELVAGDRRQPVRGRVARLLIALVTARRPQTLERLADAVWSGAPPPTYRAALHVHLGSLRKALSDLGGDVSVLRDGDAYSLHLGNATVDAVLAAELISTAEATLARHPVAARERLEAALAMWRGTPYAVDDEVIDLTASVQADAARRDAEELLVESLLAAGDAPAAEEAALRLVDEEPTRERRWGQLLRARFLAGRTADALATYQSARTTLIELLGIEPGRELRDLEAAALTEDLATLQLPHTVAPQSLPMPPTSIAIVGRDAELARLNERIARAQPTLLLGPPGVGKTRLALEGARHHPDVTWIDARDPAHTSAMSELREWVRLHPKGAIVFDNAELDVDAVADSATQIRQHAPGVAVVVTSRVPIPFEAAVEIVRPLPVPAPSDDDESIERAPAAIALRDALAELAPHATLTSAEVALLCRRTAGLPLAVRLIAAAARALPASALVLRGIAAESEQIDVGVRAVLAVLPESTQAAFADLSAIGSDFDTALASSVTALVDDALATALVQLVDHGLVQAHPGAALEYSMLEPVREVADRILGASGRRPTTLDRLADGCIDRAVALNAMSAAGDVDLAARLSTELPRLRSVLDHLADRGDEARALELVCRLEVPLYTVGWWAEKTELFDRALAIPGPPSVMRARAHCFRARPGPLHLFDARHAEQGEAMAAEIGHELLLAFARHIRSVGLWWSGDLRLAIELATDAANRFEAVDRMVEWSEARKFLGVSMVFAGDVEDGLAVLHDALATVRRRGGTPFHVAHHLAYLGHCQRMLGDDEAARADLTEASDLCRAVGNRGTAIHIEIGLADLAVDRSDAKEALARVAVALDLISAAGGWTYEPWAWTVAIRAHALAGDLDAALTCGRRALVELPRVPPGESVRLAGELAQVAVLRGDLETAARLLAVAHVTSDVRELPFPPHAEQARMDALDRTLDESLGAADAERLARARQLSLSEAAGPLLRA